MRIPIIAGNWKMYKTTGEAEELVENLKKKCPEVAEREVVVCPPFTCLLQVSSLLVGTKIQLGAQNMYWEDKGAFTGEIAPLMLKDAGCRYVIVGHSERRQYFSETDITVNKKVKKAFSSGLIPILCIGETLIEREKNITFEVLSRQLREGIRELDVPAAEKLVIAYEPVWAIGTGKTATPRQAEEAHHYIRTVLTELYSGDVAAGIRILYGGSVKPENIDELMARADIDGALVGGASLEADSFSRIIHFRW